MIDFPIKKIIPAAERNGVFIDKTKEEMLNIYGNLLVNWNEKMNLTAITEPTEVVTKHFLDSLTFFCAVTPKENASVIDVGTGAGFPGLVLKIVRPDIKLTLLDGLNKRLVFLNEVLKETSLSADTVHLRAEEGGKKAEYREKFDFATARAVAKMNVLSEYCLPFVKVGGSFVALKGPTAKEEIEDAKKAISLLGGKIEKTFSSTLTGNEERTVILTKKISQTPTKYPRISAKISKQPL